MTRRVGPADLPPGPRQFVRRRCVLVHSRSLGLLVDILGARFYSYNSSTRRSALSLWKDISRSSPTQYIEGFRRRGAPGWVN
ncbi:hypothetical protein T12_11801 [Trichinella patagoniensis]|uniref:Uncharacterized protein n=1 Tax=Trichinella patagoniensis TaxID=990121 RepID=A0A0V1A7B0_9BILA|nr:hypothetical protein T12_11801 [Trichinella patagoniensis]